MLTLPWFYDLQVNVSILFLVCLKRLFVDIVKVEATNLCFYIFSNADYIWHVNVVSILNVQH